MGLKVRKEDNRTEEILYKRVMVPFLKTLYPKSFTKILSIKEVFSYKL